MHLLLSAWFITWLPILKPPHICEPCYTMAVLIPRAATDWADSGRYVDFTDVEFERSVPQESYLRVRAAAAGVSLFHLVQLHTKCFEKCFTADDRGMANVLEELLATASTADRGPLLVLGAFLESGDTLLVRAAKEGLIGSVKALLKAGADPNCRVLVIDRDTVTPTALFQVR